MNCNLICFLNREFTGFVISAGLSETDVPRYKLRAESTSSISLADVIQTPVFGSKTGAWIILAKPNEEVLSALTLYLGTSVSVRPAEIRLN